MNKRTKYIPAIVMLTAGAIVSVVSIIQKRDVLESLKLLLLVLVIFYIVGLVAYKIVDKILLDFREKELDEQLEAPEEEENAPEEEESED